MCLEMEMFAIGSLSDVLMSSTPCVLVALHVATAVQVMFAQSSGTEQAAVKCTVHLNCSKP